MARPEQRLVRDGTPLRELAFWLRDLRTGSGLTYAQLAARSGYSVSTLQEAAAGRRLPTLAVTLAFARACGADPEAWQRYWTQVRRAVDSGTRAAPGPPWSTGTDVEAAEPVTPHGAESGLRRAREASSGPAASPGVGPDEPGPPLPAGTSRPKAARTVRIAAASGLLLVAVGVPGGLWWALSPDRPEYRDFASVVVQNKVAIGPTALVEDKTPSTCPVRRSPTAPPAAASSSAPRCGAGRN